MPSSEDNEDEEDEEEEEEEEEEWSFFNFSNRLFVNRLFFGRESGSHSESSAETQ